MPKLSWLLILLGIVTAARPAQSQNFDYYVLSLSWAPDFCASPAGEKNFRECGPGRHMGFVVHGLWPQYERGRGPERCGPTRPVSRGLADLMLHYFPTPGLIQHEWEDHGTCSGMSPDQYFAAVRSARDSLKIPQRFTTINNETADNPGNIENYFARNNPNFPRAAFRATCRNGGLQEVRVCFDKGLHPRPCTFSVGECRDPQIRILPPR
jgi:ribonuclease T2